MSVRKDTCENTWNTTPAPEDPGEIEEKTEKMDTRQKGKHHISNGNERTDEIDN